MASFTTGPWRVNTLDGRLPVVRRVKMPHGEADTYTSTILAAKGQHVCRLDFGYGRESDEANALVLAAAADYHEAAKELVDRHDALANRVNFDRCGCPDCKPFRAAIAKAEGSAASQRSEQEQ